MRRSSHRTANDFDEQNKKKVSEALSNPREEKKEIHSLISKLSGERNSRAWKSWVKVTKEMAKIKANVVSAYPQGKQGKQGHASR